jgi:hypothetical protein
LNTSASSTNKQYKNKIRVRKKTPDMALTKNHESVKFRLRIQQQKEAAEELKAFDEDLKRTD